MKLHAWKKICLIALTFLALIHGLWFVRNTINTPRPLTVGVFVDISPQIYERIDAAARATNTVVQYERGIMRKDYGEWLAAKFLTSDEPAVFILPHEDFAMYAKMNALAELPTELSSTLTQNPRVYGEYQGQVFALAYETDLVAISAKAADYATAVKFLTAFVSAK